jgi:diguanylate cyclase (GGDEF)-like protein
MAETGQTERTMAATSTVEGFDGAVATATPEVELRETNGITSRLLLLYLQREGGRRAVEQVLDRCGLRDREAQLLDENYWFSYAEKVALFEAAAEVLEDSKVMLHIGDVALELNVGEGLKIALRALGSPRLVYQNIVRANAKFTGSHTMELLELGRDYARISYTDRTPARRYHPLDCEYNQGMLACVPGLFGRPPARVSHAICGCRGGPACVYELRWDGRANEVRIGLLSGVVGGGAAIGSALLAPVLLPVGIAVAALAAVTVAWRAARQVRARQRQLEAEAREQSQVAERLSASLQDLVSELRLEEVLAKVTANAQLAVGGKEFALLIDDGDGPRCQSSTSLAPSTVAVLERWAQGVGSLEEPLTVDDVTVVPELVRLSSRCEVPFGSICAAPLIFRGRHLGVLIALATSPRTFLPPDVDLIQSYASQAAIALANASMYQALEELASRDHLTGLLNHREFHESLNRELERCRRYAGQFSVVLFDLNRFKTVNDSYGHAQGDRVLRDVGEALARSCRSSDLAFRVGGDEFAYILPETDADAALAAAERARDAVGALPGRLDVSYGATVWPIDGSGRDELLERADVRLYQMKRDQRGDSVASLT